ncbi:MAG TPA: transcription antitermination factor NusB [Candidatus Tumulicola sp.]|nr:transcription antitermination factor NusB [Candidatus Tumulicola sp.]
MLQERVKSVSPARAVAWRALLKGGDAAGALDRESRAAHLDPRDRRLATELAHGTLKRRRSLEWALQKQLRRPFAELDRGLQWALLLGAYQLLYLDRVPAHSAVNESVALARAGGHAGTAAVANAILRKLALARVYPPKPEVDDPPSALGLYASLPDWLAEHFIERFGFGSALQIADAINATPRRALRVDTDAAPAGGKYGIPECLIVEDGIADERQIIQSEESQLAVHLLAPKPGETILDACAGRGVKTGMIAARLGGKGTIYAIDDDERKLEHVRRLAAKSPTPIVVMRADAKEPYPDAVPQEVDAALVDAPCSGIGIIGRRADARWRKKADDPIRFSSIQQAILERAAERVAPRGRLLYATCSTHPAEDEDVVANFLTHNPEWSATSLASWAAKTESARALGPYLLTVPGVDGNDGFFYALLEKKRDDG